MKENPREKQENAVEIRTKSRAGNKEKAKGKRNATT
jgi:hypothetical protein